MPKRLRMGLYNGEALLQIAQPGFDVETCDKDSSVETAFDSNWSRLGFLQSYASGTVVHSQSNSAYNEESYREVALGRQYSEPLFLWMRLHKNGIYYQPRMVRFVAPGGSNPPYYGGAFTSIQAQLRLSNSSGQPADWRLSFMCQTLGVVYSGGYHFNPVYGSDTLINIEWTLFRMDYDPVPSW